MDFVHLTVLYLHLVACCIAIGTTLTADVAALRRVIRGQSTERRHADVTSLKTTIVVALACLWITGLVLVATEVLAKGSMVLGNPKLQAKLLLVLLLSMNGVLLHRMALPALIKAGSILNLAPSLRKKVLFAGVISAVSWMYIAFLGLARPLAWKYSLAELLVFYPLLVVAAFFVANTLIHWSSRKHGHIGLKNAV